MKVRRPKRNVSRIRRTSLVLLVLTVSLGIAATGCGTATPDSEPPNDVSGVKVVTTDYVNAPPEALREVLGVAMRLGMENPTDFSFPLVEEGHVTLRTTSADSAPISETGSAQDAFDALEIFDAAAAPKSPMESADRLVIETDSVRNLIADILWLPGNKSWQDTSDLNNEIFDFATAEAFKDAWAWGSEIDVSTGQIILTVNKLTPELAEGLVHRFGEAVVVREQAAPRSSTY